MAQRRRPKSSRRPHKGHGRSPRHHGYVMGNLLMTRKGYGFVGADGGDYYVGARDLNGAMHGDLVALRPTATGGPGRAGRVARVVERVTDRLIGRISIAGTLAFLRPLDSRIAYDGIVIADGGIDLSDGDIVAATIAVYPSSSQSLQVAVTGLIARATEELNEIDLIINEKGLLTEFGDDELDEVAALSVDAAQILSRDSKRRDLRDRYIFTIDPVDARDFDDAISVDWVEGLVRLGVHIADVAYFMAWDSSVDKAAKRRGASVYLPDRVLPMLPEKLSNELCSLNPEVDRLTMTVDLYIDKTGQVVSAEFYRSVIQSKRRYTYGEVDEMLSGALAFDDDVAKQALSDFARIVRQIETQRISRGALEFDSVEPKLVLDETGKLTDIKLRTATAATKMIEEAMILANETVATYLEALEFPMVYRVHEEPAAEALDALHELYREFGYAIPATEGITPRLFQSILKASHGKPEQYLVSSLLLRTLKQAYYSPTNKGHFGLASSAYTHFTSPIRRYPDVMVHRLLTHVIKQAQGVVTYIPGKVLPAKSSIAPSTPLGSMVAELAALTQSCSANERTAESAEREAINYLLCVYMQDHLGKEFHAVISSAVHFGIFVALDNTVEGLVHVSKLPSGPWEFEPAKHQFMSISTGAKLRLGQSVRVKVARVSVPERQIDFELVNFVE